MKAVRLIQPGRPLELQEVTVPAVGARDVLVRVKAAGICHSDAHYRAGKSVVRPLPLTLGHEVAGVVERAGAEVTQFQGGGPGLPALPGELRGVRLLPAGERAVLHVGRDDGQVS